VERSDDGEDGHVQQTGSHRMGSTGRRVEGNHLHEKKEQKVMEK